MAKTLNPLTIPLAQTNLIEASAGTGKTWNIAALFLRLVLLPLPQRSQPLSVDKILVVTFTKAATAELKTRLRARLDEALAALQQAEDAFRQPENLRQACGDPFLFELLQQALANESDENHAQARVMLRLKAAISDFDNAAVYTIHSFCQRVLQDFAFLCGVPFDIELDEQSGKDELLIAAQDFWRTQIAPHADFAELLYHHTTPQKQIDTLHNFVARPYLDLRDSDVGDELSAAKRDFQAAWLRVSAQMPQINETFWQIHPNLNGVSFNEKTFRKKFDFLNEFAGSHISASTLLTHLQNSKGESPFAAHFIAEKTKKGKAIDDDKIQIIAQLDDVFQAATRLLDAEKAALVQLNHQLLQHLRQHQQRHKQRSPIRHFDDLLLDVYHALHHNPQHATALAENMAQNWQVALIDEFQDTDPLQYAIFRTAFAQSQTPLFLVGDPKQAIYSFRGADIFAYLQAAEDASADNIYTLATNRRSHSKLINSISALFSRENPFVLPEIAYQQVDASRPHANLSPQGNALTVRWLNRHDDDDKDNAAKLEKRAASYCASEIAQMLNQSAAGSLKLRGEPLRADQIAVLVRARKDGVLVQRELKKRGIQSVLLSRDSIFAEPEAEALAALLDFFIQPQRTAMLRFVLSGCLFEYTAEEILQLNQQETELLKWIDSAQSCLNVWLEHGIYAAIQQFITRHGVETRLLTQRNERTLTNLHQLMELLAQEDEQSHSPTSLRQWLGQHIEATRERESGSEHILRLESDENLVKIVTMHASKGLQYPIVFCPFAWKASGGRNVPEWQIIHHGTRAELVHKNQLNQNDKEMGERERLSEDLRLMYVACTRAEEQLHLYMASYDGSDRSAFAYLLDAQDVAKQPENYWAAWQNFAQNQQSAHTDLHLIDEKQSRVEQAFVPPPQEQHFQAAEFPPRRYQFVRHTSFTGLSKQHQRATEQAEAARAELLPALDSVEQTPIASPLTSEHSIHQFPQGTTTGLCWHGILEKSDFSQPAASQIALIDEQLSRYGFDPDLWRETMINMLDDVRQAPIFAGQSLAQSPAENHLMEWGFLLHTDDFKVEDLREWFRQPHLQLAPEIVQAAQGLHFYDVHGFINGFVDLFYHDEHGTVVVDYKSHHLGDDAAAYHIHALNQAVAAHHYYLQALIYAIAVARYLQSRHALPETIAVRFVFLRGLGDEKAQGIWAWDIATQDLQKWL